MPAFDVITFGETMIRLSPPDHGRLETTRLLDFQLGGSESNTAIALSRLGRKVSWWSRLPEGPLGRRIAMDIGKWGVDTSSVLWTESGRVGVYFIEFGSPPRPHHVYYDRADSAVSRLTPDMVDWSHLDSGRHLHLTGITAALSEGCLRTVERAIREAKDRKMTVSFDLNYRKKLWSAEEAKSKLTPLLANVDLLFCPAGDAEAVFNLHGHSLKLAKTLQQQLGPKTVVVPGSGDGTWAVDGDRDYHSPNIRAVEVDRIGSGDAGNAGIMNGYLDGDFGTGLRYGSAMAALKLSIPGDELIATRDEIEAVVRGATSGVQR
jgi:2-dehydro-3-deoxygluconokinase